MSPVVLRLPLIAKSLDSVDAGGFAFGAVAAGAELEDEEVGAELLGAGAASLLAGALADLVDVVGFAGSFLENIVRSLHVVYRIKRFAAQADFIMQVNACAFASCPHSTNQLTLGDAFTL